MALWLKSSHSAFEPKQWQQQWTLVRGATNKVMHVWISKGFQLGHMHLLLLLTSSPTRRTTMWKTLIILVTAKKCIIRNWVEMSWVISNSPTLSTNDLPSPRIAILARMILAEPDDKLYSGVPITSRSSTVLLLSFVFKHNLTRPNSCKAAVWIWKQNKGIGDTVNICGKKFSDGLIGLCPLQIIHC